MRMHHGELTRKNLNFRKARYDGRLTIDLEMKNVKIFVIIGALVFGLAALLYIIGQNRAPFVAQGRAFVSDELHGVLLELRDIKRGDYVIRVSQQPSGSVEYTVTFGSFIEKNNIQQYDSISKEAGSNDVKFYKKQGSGFVACCTRTVYVE
jgi:hypothetical protein